ncbi:ATP-binding protein [Paralimibaculum aggregatum]|uniref:histidine kinase n=1 Tax=Paralimibaculum aggregatum TaxID=3036245 RepID=A0ABQ6LJW5_9RHOB|nr:ATP-binding protein [Limibaculum sp. NKW23]GMG83550.1 ATP-binding protein [Limibaculum sp. NKW23]
MNATMDQQDQLWHSLPAPALMADATLAIRAVNTAAETFLGASQRQLEGRNLVRLVGEDSRLVDLIRQVLEGETKTAEYDVELLWPEMPPRLVDIHAAPYGSGAEGAVVLIHPRAIAETMDRSLSHRNAARSVAGMAAMLAHEVKNPLAGIAGAAELLESSVTEADRELTQLIRDEAKRIGKLMARVEQFGEIGPGVRKVLNIHDVLDRARRAAQAGFAAHVRFVEEFDPSLPPTMGDPDQLMQALLNLLKNAAEAAPQVGGVIQIRSAFRAGMKLRTPNGRREGLPLQITVTDNGPGVPDELRRHIFEPFVSSKASGSGLGLSLVSKVVADHGGIIVCDSEPGWTRFRLALPMASEAEIAAAEAAGSDKENAA